jgi:uncharacterized protein
MSQGSWDVLRFFLTVLGIGVIAYLGLCAALFAFQRSLIYYPQPGVMDGSPSSLRLPVSGADLRITIRPHDGPHALIYFGGNGEEVSWNLPIFSSAFPDHAIYLLHYRGYGGSSGTPSEAAIQQDALALFDKVQAEHPKVVVIGRSLGSGVAIRVAGERPVSRLILVTPYDSLQGIAARRFPYVPVSWLLRDKFESWRHAPKITVPTLVLAAEHDEVIPRSSTEQLVKRFAPSVVTFKVLPGSHNSISDDPAYLSLLRAAR